MRSYYLNSEQRLARPIGEVFGFFADPRNLETLTPPWLRFAILTPGDIEMKCGTRIDYRLHLHGVPMRWQSEITAWEPPHRFVDEQRRGPYRLWVHEHVFKPEGGGTLVSDRVQYAVAGGAVVQKLLVARDLNTIFAFRRNKLIEIFA